MKKYASFFLTLLVLCAGFTSCDDDDSNNDVYLEAFGPSPALKGGELRFLGRNLDKVSAIILPDNITVTNIEKVSAGEIKITVPEETAEGYVTLKTPNGDIVTKTKLTISENIVITKVYKTGSEDVTTVIAGDEITIEGENLGSVRYVIFAENAAVSLNREGGGSYPADVITVKVPLEAQSGYITLSNGADIPIRVSSNDYLTVTTPTAGSISHSEVEPGTELVIIGTNLQLAKYVRFVPGMNVEIPQGSDPLVAVNQISVIVPSGAQSGEVKLIGYSGVEIVAGEIKVTVPVVSSLTEKANVGDVIQLTGINLDNVKSVIFGTAEATTFTQQTETSLFLVVPDGAKLGSYKLKITDSKGKEYEVTSPIEINNIEAVKTTDLMFMDFEAHGQHNPSEWDPGWGGVTEFLTNDEGNVYVRITKAFGAEQWVVNCNHQGTEGTLTPVIDDVTQYVMKVDMKVENDFTIGSETEFTLVAAGNWTAKSAKFFPLAADGVTCTTGGGWITVTVDLSEFGFTSGALDLSKTGDTGLFVKTNSMDPTGLCMDNWRFSKK